MEVLLSNRQKAFVSTVLQFCWRCFLHGLRSVFKNRLNFLNSTPSSTVSALRLLSAPSVRFWQQIAICPVSLCALVVELHPLNWARAQAVRRISDKVTMKELEKQRVCVCVCVCGEGGELCCKLGKNCKETFQLLVGSLFKKFGLFLNTLYVITYDLHSWITFSDL